MKCEDCGFKSENLTKFVIGTDHKIRCRKCAGCILFTDKINLEELWKDEPIQEEQGEILEDRFPLLREEGE